MKTLLKCQILPIYSEFKTNDSEWMTMMLNDLNTIDAINDIKPIYIKWIMNESIKQGITENPKTYIQ